MFSRQSPPTRLRASSTRAANAAPGRRSCTRWRIIIPAIIPDRGSPAAAAAALRRRVRVEGKDLRKAGLKVTLPRLKILEILEGSATRHMSAEDIYRTLLESNEDIGLATVYRVLTQFEAAGLVTRQHFEDGMAVVELNQGTHHDHIVCQDCGRVEEFMDSGIEERQTAVATKLGFTIRDHSLILYGRCKRPNCAFRNRGKSS